MIKLGFDIDGVLADFSGGLSEHVEAVHGVKLSKSPTSWYWEENNVNKTDLTRWVNEAGLVPGFWEHLNPINLGDIDLVSELSRIYPLFFVSFRRPEQKAFAETMEWMRTYGIHPATLAITENKRAVAEALALDALIEDRDKTVRLFNGSKVTCFLIDRPWNRDARDLDKMRVFSIREFLARSHVLV